jgi:DNA-binding SARP family transcriptional activator
MRTLQWRPDAPHGLDVADFERALVRAEEAEQRGDRAAARVALEKAAQLYTGDLFLGCYDDWIEHERDRLRQENIEGLEHLVRLLEDQRSYREAISYARRLLQQDPLRENTYRCLMRLHALEDDRASGLRTYYDLRRELGADPDPATRAVLSA